MLKLIRLTAAALAFSAAASAQAYAGKVPEPGWPICTDKDELQEYFLAMLKKNDAWLKSLKSCGMAPAGLEMVTIEDYDSDSDFGHVAKVRLIGAGSKRSVVGYILKLKDGPAF